MCVYLGSFITLVVYLFASKFGWGDFMCVDVCVFFLSVCLFWGLY